MLTKTNQSGGADRVRRETHTRYEHSSHTFISPYVLTLSYHGNQPTVSSTGLLKVSLKEQHLVPLFLWLQVEHLAARVGLCSQNALLPSVLRLCEGRLDSSSSSSQETLALSAMKTLGVLIERTPHTHSDRYTADPHAQLCDVR